MLKIAYISLTGNIKRYISNSNIESNRVIELDVDNQYEIKDDFILIVPSYDEDFHKRVISFLEYKNNYKKMCGVIGSGNRNFADSYCFSAYDISNKFKSPILFVFEFSGTNLDVLRLEEEVKKIEQTL